MAYCMHSRSCMSKHACLKLHFFCFVFVKRKILFPPRCLCSIISDPNLIHTQILSLKLTGHGMKWNGIFGMEDARMEWNGRFQEWNGGQSSILPYQFHTRFPYWHLQKNVYR